MSLLAPKIKDLSSSNNKKTKCENKTIKKKKHDEVINVRYKYDTEVTGGVACWCIPAEEYYSCLEATIGV